MFDLTKEDVERIVAELDETEKNCLPIAYNIMQKIVGVLDCPYSGRSEMVDTIKSVASALSDLSIVANDNE